MGDRTGIEWTDASWNPLRGCSRVSEGCRHCYAEQVAARFSGPGQPYEGLATRGPARWTGKVRLVEEHLADPLRWTKPRRIFVNSMSDLFHESVPDEWIDRVFAVMALAPQHTFQVLTKRPERMRAYLSPSFLRYGSIIAAASRLRDAAPRLCRIGISNPTVVHFPNVWLGVSVEDQRTADERIPLLLQTPAAVRFVSYEPALGPVNFDRCLPGPGPTERASALIRWSGTSPCSAPSTGLDWIIVGGESGPGARPLDVVWIDETERQCRAAGVPLFVKQFGARPYVSNVNLYDWPDDVEFIDPPPEVSAAGAAGLKLRDRKGGDMSEWPESLRRREFPRGAVGGPNQ